MPASDPTEEELRGFAIRLARRAGELQLARLGSKHDVREKAPKDPVTEVDLLCEEFLVSAIRERFPGDAILSEERGGEVSREGRTWLLDPLDGTANYARGLPLFCCCVSVLEACPSGHRVAHAAVSVPALGTLYRASARGGAWVDSDAGGTTRLRVGGAAWLEDAFAGADSRFGVSGDGGRRRPLGRLFGSCWQVRAIGSAGVRGAWVAAGHLDVSAGETNSAWDYAPTALLVTEAGGKATDLSGKPWTLASDGMLVTNGALHREALETMAGLPAGPEDAETRDRGSPRAGE